MTCLDLLSSRAAKLRGVWLIQMSPTSKIASERLPIHERGGDDRGVAADKDQDTLRFRTITH